jgi:hypothetical protein
VGHAVVHEGSVVFRWDQIALSGALALVAVIIFAYNIVRTVRTVDEAAIAAGEAGQMDERLASGEEFVITPSTVIKDVLEHVPGSLDLLVEMGFTPLLDPAMREKMTPTVTVAMAASIHNMDVQEMIARLNALKARGGRYAPG